MVFGRLTLLLLRAASDALTVESKAARAPPPPPKPAALVVLRVVFVVVPLRDGTAVALSRRDSGNQVHETIENPTLSSLLSDVGHTWIMSKGHLRRSPDISTHNEDSTAAIARRLVYLGQRVVVVVPA